MRAYRNYLIIILGIFILGNTSCNTNRIEDKIAKSERNETNMISYIEESSNAITENFENLKTSPAADTEIYDTIINQYIEGINNDFYKDILYGESNEWELIGEDINDYLMYDMAKECFEAFYALYDVDKNGIPELFLGGKFGDDDLTYYDMFTSDKAKAINPFNSLGYYFGGRTYLYLYANGILEVHWYLGGTHHGRNFYKISSDGFNMELVESVSLKPKLSENGDLQDGYYHDEKGTIEISKQEFDKILHNYQDAGEVELDWVKIGK